MTIKDLQPSIVWNNFYSITRCPRPSKHEEIIRKENINTGYDNNKDRNICRHVISAVNRQGLPEFSKSKLLMDAEMASRIKKLIADADTGVKDITIGDNGMMMSFHDQYDDAGAVVGRTNFVFSYAESQGTQKLFDLSGTLIDALHNGRVLVIDELDAQLHPILVRHLVELFNNSY